MGWPVVTVASGGMPVVDVTATTGRGTPVSEATNGFGCAVTKVASGGMAVAYETIGIAPPVVYATLDGVASTNVILSNGNLTATRNNTGAGAEGARSATLKSTGKYYFETTAGAMHGNNNVIGIVSAATTYTNIISGVGGPLIGLLNGAIYVNNAISGFSLGAITTGDVVCLAADFSTGAAWFRKNNGLWNTNASANPATGIGGLGSTVASMGAIVGFGGSGSLINDAMTVNFGKSAYAFTPPVGFGNLTV